MMKKTRLLFFFTLFSSLLFFSHFSLSLHHGVSMLTPHPAGDISYHLRFLQARKNPGTVYDQAGMLLLKVNASQTREHVSALESVCV